MATIFEKLKSAIDLFSSERDWDQFHSPKNVAMALTVEAGELSECFQWLTEEQSGNLDSTQLAAVRDEIADVQLYLIRLASRLNLDIEQACWEKIRKNAEKYPIEQVKGSARKYTHYSDG